MAFNPENLTRDNSSEEEYSRKSYDRQEANVEQLEEQAKLARLKLETLKEQAHGEALVEEVNRLGEQLKKAISEDDLSAVFEATKRITEIVEENPDVEQAVSEKIVAEHEEESIENKKPNNESTVEKNVQTVEEGKYLEGFPANEIPSQFGTLIKLDDQYRDGTLTYINEDKTVRVKAELFSPAGVVRRIDYL